MRILVIKRHHKSECNLTVRLMIKEAPAPIITKRPTLRMDYASGNVIFRINIPQFLHAKPVNLRLAIGLKIITRLQLLGQVSPRALGKQRIFAVKLHPRLIIAFMAAIMRDAHIARRYAFDCAALMIKNFGRRKAWKNLNAKSFSLFGEPAAHVAKRSRVTAIIAHERRHHNMRQRIFALGCHDPVQVICDGRLRHWATLRLPIGEQLIKCFRINHRARKDMRAHFRAFFEDADRGFGIKLFQTDRAGQPGRAASHDHNIIFHRLPFAHFCLQLLRYFILS